MPVRAPQALALKPDLADAAPRWSVLLARDLIDRPVVCVSAPRPGTCQGGESIPSFSPSFGCNAIAVLCGAKFVLNEDLGDTCWSEPFVDDWEKELPLHFNHDHPLWRRMLRIYERGTELMTARCC